MINPVILFVPVSSDKGVGEYTRSLIIANAVQQKLPEAQIHFILNKNMKLANGCQYQTHFSKFSATKDTPLVNEIIAKIRPNIVIFDCAGRSQQFATAKRYGAKVVFISQHRKKRARGLTLRRLLFCDLQWVVQPTYAIQPLNRFEQLKLKILGKKPPKNIGPIVPKINSDSNILEEYSLKEEQYVLFSAGSGGHIINGELAADVFYRAALELAEKVDCKIVMVFGANYPKSLPVDSSIICLSHVPTEEFLTLLKKARHRVLSAGSTLLQVIELKLVSLAIAISKDQPSRLKRCARLGLVLKSKCDETAIVDGSLKLFEESTNRDIKKNLKVIEPTLGIAEVLLDIGRLIDSDIEYGLKKMNSGDLKNKSNKSKKYLFFISQNYSFAILRPLQEEIWARGDEVKWFLFGKEVNFDYLHDNEDRIFSVTEIVEYNPIAVFAPGNYIPSFIPGLKVAVFHGFNVGKLNRRGQQDHFNIRGCFDLYCTQGPNTTIPFRKLAKKHGYFSIEETGWSALDPLFKSVEQKTNEKPTVLMCSTFSRSLTCAPHLYEEVKRLRTSSKWNWLVQFHPKMSIDIVEKYKKLENENLKFVETDNIIPLLKEADVMLCDTSSVLLMFILLDKPVVTFNSNTLGEHLINFKIKEQLEERLSYALTRPKSLMKSIEIFNAELHPYKDGNSSQRVLNAVESLIKERKNSTRKPLNLIRNLKMRRELGYWRFLNRKDEQKEYGE